MIFRKDASLKPFNTLALDSHAKQLVTISEFANLGQIYHEPTLRALPRVVLGHGSNVVLASPSIPGLVLTIKIAGKHILHESVDGDVLIRVGAGESWHALVMWSLEQGLVGLENLALIPGTVGAAPVQNIGAYGVELKDVFLKLEAFDWVTGLICHLDAKDCRFTYRMSRFKENDGGRYTITAVHLQLRRERKIAYEPKLSYGNLAQAVTAQNTTTCPTARDVANAVMKIRSEKLPDPAQLANAGSFFKNPCVPLAVGNELLTRFPELPHWPAADGTIKLAAGWMIDQAGWKGKSLGPVGMYEKQALVLVNHGGASGSEVMALAKAVKADVAKLFGVTLEIEPIVI